ncbi:hypothetical protein PT974_05434 [Cladobotryum mycophilum]|uniref:Uncharacterized protein n=1 Tax=Cladobotryum mycophilum TaxID=491253 RepID=A0ABR0SIS7_9HYPO
MLLKVSQARGLSWEGGISCWIMPRGRDTLKTVRLIVKARARIELEVLAATTVDGPITQERSGPRKWAATNKEAGVLMVHGVPNESAIGNGISAELASCIWNATHKATQDGGISMGLKKLNLYLSDMRLLQECLAVIYKNYEEDAPVVVPMAVNKTLQKGAHVEVEATFAVPKEELQKTPLAKYSFENYIILSGAAAIPLYSYTTAEEAYTYRSGIPTNRQAQISIDNLENVISAASLSKRNVFKTVWYLSDLREWSDIEVIAQRYFQGQIPNPSVIEISKLSLPMVNVEVEFWVAKLC